MRAFCIESPAKIIHRIALFVNSFLTLYTLDLPASKPKFVAPARDNDLHAPTIAS